MIKDAWTATFVWGCGVAVGVTLAQWTPLVLVWCRKSQQKDQLKDLKDDEIHALVRQNILHLKPYRCARDDYDRGILLDANENSYGPSLPQGAYSTEDALERYPCPYQLELKQAIAKFRCIQPAQIFLGVGSDEAIDLLIRIFCRPGKDSILVTPPTYGMYSVCADINDVQILSSPLTPDFEIVPEKILKTVNVSTKLIFLCHPGNPTAKLLNEKDILAILESDQYQGMVVVDEAYIDFAGKNTSMCKYLDKYARLIVLQTMSKSFGLAGIRLGMALANEKTIQLMNNVKAPYNINKLTSKMAIQAFSDLSKFHANIESTKSEKARVIKALAKIATVGKIHPSDSNFVVFEIQNAFEVYKRMAEEGVVIRYRGNLIHLTGCLRATIGTPTDNDAMLQLLESVSLRLQAAANKGEKA